jgi:hypothetical protein
MRGRCSRAVPQTASRYSCLLANLFKRQYSVLAVDELRDNDEFLYAFDLIELHGEALRREPLEQRKVDVNCRAAMRVNRIGPVGDQASVGGVEAERVDRGQTVLCRESDDQRDEEIANPLNVTIRPPFNPATKAVTARSILRGSRTSTALSSTPQRRRHGLWPRPDVTGWGRAGVCLASDHRWSRSVLVNALTSRSFSLRHGRVAIVSAV